MSKRNMRVQAALARAAEVVRAEAALARAAAKQGDAALARAARDAWEREVWK
jgi:hypothetical protein